MNQLSKDLKTSVVLTYTGERYFITKEQDEHLRWLSDKDKIDLGGSLLKVSNIIECLPYEKWKETEDYRKYLDNQPEERRIFEQVPYQKRTEEGHKRAMRKMKEGFESYFGEQGREIPEYLKKGIYKKMERYV